MKIIDKINQYKEYFLKGVWREPKNNLRTRIIKTLNLSYFAFTNRNLQSQSMSLTYSTVLGIVPLLALLFAIARGFGLQNIIEKELFNMAPSQHQALETAISFVDSCLKQSSQGLFVGVGIIFLLWTLYSILSNVENVFNSIWNIRQDRSMYQKVTDYIAICLMVPILMACSAGVQIFMATITHTNTALDILSPLVDFLLELSPIFLAWLAITLAYFLVPNTKVSFKYAAIAGAFAAVGIEVVQFLFLTGQIYVSKYNAIYGSFSFLPLMLIWLQLSWLILLIGCVLSHSLQNVFSFNYLGDVTNVSSRYMREISLATMTIIVQRFDEGRPPLTRNEISQMYNLPLSIIANIINRLTGAGLVYNVSLKDGTTGLIPAVDNDKFTLGKFYSVIDTMGDEDFIPYFYAIFANLLDYIKGISGPDSRKVYDTLLRDLPIPTPAEVKKILATPGITPYKKEDTPDKKEDTQDKKEDTPAPAAE